MRCGSTLGSGIGLALRMRSSVQPDDRSGGAETESLGSGGGCLRSDRSDCALPFALCALPFARAAASFTAELLQIRRRSCRKPSRTRWHCLTERQLTKASFTGLHPFGVPAGASATDAGAQQTSYHPTRH